MGKSGILPISKLNDAGDFQCLRHSNSTIRSLEATFFLRFFNFFTFILGGQLSLPQRAINRKSGSLPTSKWKGTGDFQCLRHSNWTICSLGSSSCSLIFWTFSLLYWEANSYYPKSQLWKKCNSPIFRNDTADFQCLRNSKWTICSLGQNLWTFSLSYWKANYCYRKGPIMEQV